MTNFYDNIDNMFDILYDKYNNNTIFLDELIELKSNIIKSYEITKLDKSFEKSIVKSIKLRHFKVKEDGKINSY